MCRIGRLVASPFLSEMIALTEKQLLAGSTVVVGYFTAYYLVYQYGWDHVLLDVFWELLSFPFLGIQLFLLGTALVWLIRRKSCQPTYRTLLSFVILAASTCLMLASILGS